MAKWLIIDNALMVTGREVATPECGECCGVDTCDTFLRMHFPGGTFCESQITLPPMDIYLCAALARCIGGGRITIGTVMRFGALCWTAVEEIAREDMPVDAKIIGPGEYECNPEGCDEDLFFEMVPCECKTDGFMGPVWVCAGRVWDWVFVRGQECFISCYFAPDGEEYCLKPGPIGIPEDGAIFVQNPCRWTNCCSCCDNHLFRDIPGVNCRYETGEFFEGSVAFCTAFYGNNNGCVGNTDFCKRLCCCDLTGLTGTASGFTDFENRTLGSRVRYDVLSMTAADEVWTYRVRVRRWSGGELFEDIVESGTKPVLRCHPEWIGLIGGFPFNFECEDDRWHNTTATASYSCNAGSLRITGHDMFNVVFRDSQMSMSLNFGANVCGGDDCAFDLGDLIRRGGGRQGGARFTPAPTALQELRSRGLVRL